MTYIKNLSKFAIDQSHSEKNDEYLDIAVIAEVKRASPSKGKIDTNLHFIEKNLEYVSTSINCFLVFTELK